MLELIHYLLHNERLIFFFNYEFRQFLGKIGPKINLSRNFTDFEVINHILL